MEAPRLLYVEQPAAGVSPETQEACPVCHLLTLGSGLSLNHFIALRGGLQAELLPDYNTKPMPQVRDVIKAR